MEGGTGGGEGRINSRVSGFIVRWPEDGKCSLLFLRCAVPVLGEVELEHPPGGPWVVGAEGG